MATYKKPLKWIVKHSAPVHGKDQVREMFEEEKKKILAPLVPYLRSYSGEEYEKVETFVEGVSCSPAAYYGKNCSPDGSTVFYSIHFKASIPPQIAFSRASDTYSTDVYWDPESRNIRSFKFGVLGLKAFPRDAVVEAVAVAGEWYGEYKITRLQRLHPGLWYPSWYPHTKFSSLTENNVMQLTFRFGDRATEPRTMPYHKVAIDVPNRRVLHVEKDTQYTGPMH